MISEQLSTSLDTLAQEFGQFADSLPSVSSGDILTSGESENGIIFDKYTTGQTYDTVYVPYDGAFQVYNNAEQVPDFISFSVFIGFALGVILCAICSLFRVSIDFFSDLIK